MKKTRFLWIHDLPAKCRDSDLRSALERHGSIQKIRLFKKGDIRDAIVSFVDIKSATAVVNSENKLNNTLLKVEYCDSSDFPGYINNKTHRTSESSNSIPKSDKDQYVRNLFQKTPNDTHSLTNNDQLGREPLIFKRAKNNNNLTNNNQVLNQVLRPVQSSALNLRVSSAAGLRGLKIGDLPPVSKVSDVHLRQSLFTEFRRCGRIQSVVIPNVVNGSNGDSNNNSSRLAIVTFRRSEEAEYAYQAILSGSKVLFASPVTVELHPGFSSSNNHNNIDDVSTKRSSVVTSNALVKYPSSTNTNNTTISTSTNQLTSNKSHGMRSIENHQILLSGNAIPAAHKLPTRTLHVSGLTVGPNGPVTAEQLTTAFRKFGDIINVQLLRSSSQSALIQFAEMRGSIRAMNAHSRDPLRLGGRPLTLFYTPSPPANCLWISDLPTSLSNLTGEELLHNFSQIVPVQEIALINRSDQARRKQVKSPTNSALNSKHYAAYIRLISNEHAIRLLSELRSDKYFPITPDPNSGSASNTSTNNSARLSATTSSRRPVIAVDFASPRQSSVVSSLQLSATRSSLNSHRIKIISSSNLDQWNSCSRSSADNFDALVGSGANTILTNSNYDNKVSNTKKLSNCNSTTTGIPNNNNNTSGIKSTITHRSIPLIITTTTTTTTTSTASSGTNHSHNSQYTDQQCSVTNTWQKDGTNLRHRLVNNNNAKKLSNNSNKQNSETNHKTNTHHHYHHQRLYEELDSSHLKHSRDTSPSTFSTSSDTSSSSSSSSSSSTSSSSVSSDSSSVSSTSLSESSLTSSSAASLIQNSSSTQLVNHLSISRLHQQTKTNSGHRTRTNNTTEQSSSLTKGKSDTPTVDGLSSVTKLKQIDKKCSSDSFLSKSWINESVSDSSIAHHPLRVVTTTTTTTSIALSPSRNSTASSGGLSSPGVSCHLGNGSTTITTVKTPSLNDSGCYGPMGIFNSIPNQNVSFKSSNTVTGLTVNEFKVSPTSRACSVSASSGVSSGGPSFGSANSSGGGSTGSSPLNNPNSLSSHGQPAVGLNSKSINSTNTLSHNKLTSHSPLVKRGENETSHQRLSSNDNFDNLKQCPNIHLSSGSLKLHLSSGAILPPSSTSPSGYANLSCTPPPPTTAATTTTSLTVSIKLTGANRQSQTSRLVSTPSLSTELLHSINEKSIHDSIAQTPVSAPPHGCKTYRHPSKNTRRKSDSIEHSVAEKVGGGSADWWTSSSTPVYESMYDKIKRRTNKEAEERRKRQAEALAVKEKKRRKQQKRDQSKKSPLVNNIPFTPESFGSEHSEKTAITYSSEKSRHSSSALSKADNIHSPQRELCSKGEMLSANSFTCQSRPCRLNNDPDNDSHLLTRRLASRTKRRHSTVSSFSSSLSSDDGNSNSPPGTLTRLSLGMRFPVSATYHECIRPSKLQSTRKWSHISEPDNDDNLSQLSSSLSCSSSDDKLDNSKSNITSGRKLLTKLKASNYSSSYNVLSCVGANQNTTTNTSNKYNHKFFNKSAPSTDWLMNDSKKPTSRNQTFKRLKSSNIYESSKQHRRKFRRQKTVDQQQNDSFGHNHMKRQHSHVFSLSCQSDVFPNKRKCTASNDTASNNSKLFDSHTNVLTSPQTNYRHRGHSPKPYFSDDATVLDSEAEDNKSSFISSDSVSHTTCTSDRHSLKDMASARSHHHRHHQQSYQQQQQHMSPADRSETDESNVFESESRLYSPNSLHSNNRSLTMNSTNSAVTTTPLNEYNAIDRISKRKKSSTNSTTLCSVSNLRSIHGVNEDSAVVFDALIDSDRFSANSKSTVSTEPMEQCELNDDSPRIKFTDDDDDVDEEWHSGIPSSSPHPIHLEFDDVDDDSEPDKKPSNTSLMFQPGPLITHTSPIQISPNRLLDSSDGDDDGSDEKVQDSFMEQDHSQAVSPDKMQLLSNKIDTKPLVVPIVISNIKSESLSAGEIFPLLDNSDQVDGEKQDVTKTVVQQKSCEEMSDSSSNVGVSGDINSPNDKKKTDDYVTPTTNENKICLKISDLPISIDNKPECILPSSSSTSPLPTTTTITTLVTPTVTIASSVSYDDNNNNNSSNSMGTCHHTLCATTTTIATNINNVINSLKSINSSSSSSPSTLILNTLADSKFTATTQQKYIAQFLPAMLDINSTLTQSATTTTPITAVTVSTAVTTTFINLIVTTTPTSTTIPTLSMVPTQKPGLIERTVEMVSTSQTQATNRQPTQTPVKSTNNAVTSAGGSLVYTTQLTEAHDIKRYVQSVIERVKAERVEENQQAAAAAAHCHHQHHSSAISTGLISPSYPLPAAQVSKSSNEITNNGMSPHTYSRRSITGQRRSLLVTASTCSSTKTNAPAKCSKWLANLVATTAAVAVNATTTTTSPVSATTFATFISTGSLSTNQCSSVDPIQNVPISAVTCTVVTCTNTITTDVHMLSIPGVNACAPLCPQVTPQNVNHRVTRQAANSVLTSNLSNAVKRNVESNINSDVISVPALNNPLPRRQKRSESKAITPMTIAVTKENTTHALTVISQALPILATSNHLSTSVSSVTSQKSILRSLDNDESVITSCIVTGSTVTLATTSKNKKPSHIPVDPYEPNFDEESPVGFDPSQLHHHRATPPSCTSPSPGSRKCLSVSNPTTFAATTTTISLAHVTTNSTVKSVVQTVAAPVCSDSTITIQSSNTTTTDCITTCLPTTTTCVTTSTMDTVDEVIRDVCAGQFDVQSYFSNWRSHPNASSAGSGTNQTSKTTTNSANEVVQQMTTTLPLSSVVTAVCSNKTTASMTSPPAAAVAVPFPISGEPVVAAVTIPVSSNNGLTKPSTTGKNATNSVVNIGTGNALLNTLLAALQLIPGSQVTVTGPAAAASVVGNLGVNNPCAISATTITLPVNATRQAAANIKAAVLSATGGNINGTTTQVNNLIGESINNNILTQVSSNASASLSTTINSTLVSTSPVAAATTTNSSPSHTTDLTTISNSSINSEPSVVLSQNNNSNIQSFQLHPIIINNNDNNKTRVAVNPNNPNLTNNSITFPNRVPATNPGIVTSVRNVASTTILPSFSYKSPILSFGSNPDIVALNNSAAATSIITTTAAIERSTSTVTTTKCTDVTNTITCTPQQVLLNHQQQQRIPCTLKSSNAHLSSLLTTSARNVSQTAPDPPVSPHMTLLSPPSATMSHHQINPVLQNMIDHLTTGVEPSVAIAIVHAALNNAGLRRGLTDNLTESQLSPYIRQVIQQLMDSRNVGTITTAGTTTTTTTTTTTKISNNLSVKQQSNPSHLDSPEVYPNISCTTNTGPVSVISHPAATMAAVSNNLNMTGKSAILTSTTITATTTTSSSNSNPVSITNHTISPSLPITSENQFTSPICVNTVLDPDPAVDFNMGKNTIISPPIVTQRQAQQQSIESVVVSDLQNAKVDTLSWNSVSSSYPMVWQGRLSLKNIETRIALHYIQGNHNLLNACMTLLASGGGGQPQLSLVATGGPLRIVQRMRLEPAQLEGVQRKINQEGASCTCLALPTGVTPAELVQQTQILNDNFIRYMQEKMAAGIINVGHPEYQQGLYVVHIFPPCEFSHTQLNFAAPDLHRRVLQANQSHLLVVITTV